MRLCTVPRPFSHTFLISNTVHAFLLAAPTGMQANLLMRVFYRALTDRPCPSLVGFRVFLDKGKPVVRPGRKATGLVKTRSPGCRKNYSIAEERR